MAANEQSDGLETQDVRCCIGGMVPIAILQMTSTYVPVHAEPTPVVRWLMSEPVTLWDWGLYRLGEELTTSPSFQSSEMGTKYVANHRYDWDRNRIVREMQTEVFPAGDADEIPSALTE